MNNKIEHFDIIIVGAGVAGLFCALNLKNLKILIIDNSSKENINSSSLAQGGIACAISSNDKTKWHYSDTLKTGHNLNHKLRTKSLIYEARIIIDKLKEFNIDFDRITKLNQHANFNQHAKQNYLLHLEAGHNYPRILSLNSGATGISLITKLNKAILSHKNIKLLFGEVKGLLFNKHIQGVVIKDNKTHFRASKIIFAGGGYGALFNNTSNNPQNTGSLISMAAMMQVQLSDLEFIQFHPTCLNIKNARKPLLSEALRGDGARITDGNGKPILQENKPIELFPRDKLTRIIYKREKDNLTTFLDCRAMSDFSKEYASIEKICLKHGFNPLIDLLPITYASHYTIGGIKTNRYGKTNLKNLFAIGECATTYIHGANRLASNSLLEAFWIAYNLANYINKQNITKQNGNYDVILFPTLSNEDFFDLKKIFTNYLAVERSNNKTMLAMQKLDLIIKKYKKQIPPILIFTKMIIFSIYKRKESRGTHYNIDYPHKLKKYQNHFSFNEKKMYNALLKKTI